MSDEIVEALLNRDTGVVGALKDIEYELSQSWNTEDGNYEVMWARVFVATLTGTASNLSSTPKELVDRAYAIANECSSRWFAEYKEEMDRRRKALIESQKDKP
jgi:hypothetical protein